MLQAQKYANEAAEWRELGYKLNDLLCKIDDPIDVGLDNEDYNILRKAAELAEIIDDVRTRDAARIANQIIKNQNKA